MQLEEIHANAMASLVRNDQSPDESYRTAIPSIFIEACEYLLNKLKEIYFLIMKESPDRTKMTQLDRNWESEFDKLFGAIHQDIENLVDMPLGMDGIEDFLIHQLEVYADRLQKMAHIPQASLPDITIRMIIDERVVGFARIPVIEVIFLNAHK